MTTFDQDDELLFRIHADIVTNGACIEYVDGVPGLPPWAYTVGLLEVGHPEVIVFGLDISSASDVLWGLVSEIEGRFVRPVGRQRRQPWLGCPPLPIRLLPVADHHWDCAGDHLLCIAAGYHRAIGRSRDELRALQLVWGTSRGTFPWHARASQRDRSLQPLLDQVGPVGTIGPAAPDRRSGRAGRVDRPDRPDAARRAEATQQPDQDGEDRGRLP